MKKKESNNKGKGMDLLVCGCWGREEKRKIGKEKNGVGHSKKQMGRKKLKRKRRNEKREKRKEMRGWSLHVGVRERERERMSRVVGKEWKREVREKKEKKKYNNNNNYYNNKMK